MAFHNDLGKSGEQLAVEFLKKKGYQILERNFEFQKAEIDIIAQKGDVACAVEVKTRSTADFGDPQEFIKPQQIKRLIVAMDHYITQNDMETEVRFDVVAIVKNKLGTRIEHLEDAFYHF